MAARPVGLGCRPRRCGPGGPHRAGSEPALPGCRSGAVLGLGLARALGLALAWLRPRAALVVSLLATAITAAVTVPNSPSEPWPWATTAAFGTSFVLAIVGARGLGRRELLTWWIVIQVLGVVAMASAPDRGDWSGLFVMAVLSGVAAVVGDLLRSRAEARRRLVEQESISKEERASAGACRSGPGSPVSFTMSSRTTCPSWWSVRTVRRIASRSCGTTYGLNSRRSPNRRGRR